MQQRKLLKRYSHTPSRDNHSFFNRDTFHTANQQIQIIPQQEVSNNFQVKSEQSPDCGTNSSCHQFEELKHIGKDDPLMQFLQEQMKSKEDNNQQHDRSSLFKQQRKQLVINRSNINTRPKSSLGEDLKQHSQNNNHNDINNTNQDSLDSTRSRESFSQWVPPSRYCSDSNNNNSHNNKRKFSCNSADRSKRSVQKQSQQIEYPNDSKELINEWKHFRQFIVVTDARKRIQNLQNNHRHLSRSKPVGAYLTNSYLLEQTSSQLEKQINNTTTECKQFFNNSNNSPTLTHGKKTSQHNQPNQETNNQQQQHQSCPSEQVKIMNFDPFKVEKEQQSPEKEIEGWYMPMGSTMPRFLKSRESILHKKESLKQQNKMKFNDTFNNTCNHSSVHTEVSSSEARTRSTTDEIQTEHSNIIQKKQQIQLHTQDLPIFSIPSVPNYKKEGPVVSRKQDYQIHLKEDNNNNNIVKRATTPLQQRTADRLARGYSASQEEIYKPSAIKSHIAQIEEINQKNMMLSNTQQFLMTEYNKFFGQEQKQRGDSPSLFMVNLGAQLSIKSVELSPSLSRQQYRRKKGIGQKDGSPIVPTRVKILQDILKSQQTQNQQDLPFLLGLKKAF